jgi:hypothetical protein
VSFLSLALWRVLEHWLRAKGLGDCARQFLPELDELRSLDVVLPVREGGEVRLQVVARPESHLAQLLARLGLKLPRVPKIVAKCSAENRPLNNATPCKSRRHLPKLTNLG